VQVWPVICPIAYSSRNNVLKRCAPLPEVCVENGIMLRYCDRSANRVKSSHIRAQRDQITFDPVCKQKKTKKRILCTSA